MINSRKAGHAARMRETRNSYKVFVENLKGRDLLEAQPCMGR
jgi:hypothetical protein